VNDQQLRVPEWIRLAKTETLWFMKNRTLSHLMEGNTLKQTNIPHWKMPNFLPRHKETNLFPPKN